MGLGKDHGGTVGGYTVGLWPQVTVHYEVFENTIWMTAYYLTFPEYRLLKLYWKHVVYFFKCIVYHFLYTGNMSYLSYFNVQHLDNTESIYLHITKLGVFTTYHLQLMGFIQLVPAQSHVGCLIPFSAQQRMIHVGCLDSHCFC